jgi:hypothetical protein
MPEQPPDTLPADFFQGGQGTAPPDSLPADFDFSAGGVRGAVTSQPYLTSVGKSLNPINLGKRALGGVEGALSPLRSLVYDPTTSQPQAANVAHQTVEGLKAAPGQVVQDMKSGNLGGLAAGIAGPMLLGRVLGPAGDAAEGLNDWWTGASKAKATASENAAALMKYATDRIDTIQLRDKLIADAKVKQLQRAVETHNSLKDGIQAIHDAAQAPRQAVAKQIEAHPTAGIVDMKQLKVDLAQKLAGPMSRGEAIPKSLSDITTHPSDVWKFSELEDAGKRVGKEAFGKQVYGLAPDVIKDAWYKISDLETKQADMAGLKPGWVQANQGWKEYLNDTHRSALGKVVGKSPNVDPDGFMNSLGPGREQVIRNILTKNGLDADRALEHLKDWQDQNKFIHSATPKMPAPPEMQDAPPTGKAKTLMVAKKLGLRTARGVAQGAGAGAGFDIVQNLFKNRP